MTTRSLSVVLLSSLLFFSGCDLIKPDASQAEEAAPAMHPAAVSVVSASAEDIPLSYEYVGQVAGSLEVDIRSRITGIIEERHFQEGSSVKAGDLLFTLDDALFEAAYQQALASIESAKAQKVSAEAELKKAKRELKRVTPLTREQMLSQNQQDDAESTVDIAEASLSVAQAAIKQAQANLLTAKVNLEYTEVRAPVEGIVGRALQNRGALVQAGSNSLLTTLVQVDPAYVDFGIPEKQQLTLRKYLNEGKLEMSEDGFVVSLVDEFGQPLGFEGEIDFQDYKVDNNTGNFAMRARVANPKQQLSPGQFVRVRMNGMVSKQSIAIPQRAVLDGPAGKYVYVAAPGENGMQVALQKNVVVGDWVDIGEERKNYWIIEDGLVAGDQVIIDGMARIFFPGMPVQIDDGSGAQPPHEGQGEKPAA